ncbi:MAG: Phosphotransferase enzyme family [Actinomycetota bacterium]|jgi:Ser/Thr protein kinase RdoA (MazF antagonist)
MAKAISFDSLPKEIRTALHRIADAPFFTIERFTPEAITVLNTRIARVYKFVRRNQRMLTLLDRELDNLILLRSKKIVSSTPLNRMSLSQYEMVVLAYVEGDLVAGQATAKHARQLAAAQKTLHSAFDKDARNKVADWNSARVLKPIFAKANAGDFGPEFLKFARALQRELKAHELSRTDITFIHADASLSNVLFQADRATMIDWAEAGWGSRYFDIGVAIHGLLGEKKAVQKELIAAYLAEYFGETGPTERDLELIELHVKLRYLAAATAHLATSKNDQLLHRPRIMRSIDESLRKATKFSLR